MAILRKVFLRLGEPVDGTRTSTPDHKNPTGKKTFQLSKENILAYARWVSRIVSAASSCIIQVMVPKVRTFRFFSCPIWREAIRLMIATEIGQGERPRNLARNGDSEKSP
ncbi:hypothetical protein Tco_1447624 [Tanacetum coccineum]